MRQPVESRSGQSLAAEHGRSTRPGESRRRTRHAALPAILACRGVEAMQRVVSNESRLASLPLFFLVLQLIGLLFLGRHRRLLLIRQR